MIPQTFTPANVDQEFRCERCGFERFVDYPIHNGASTRRDCARCHRTAGFPVWYGAPNSVDDTRAAAAAAISPRVGNLRRQVYDFIAARRERGATDEEVGAALRIKEGTARARRIELRDSAHVRDSTRRRRSTAGRLCIIWTTTGKPLS